MRVQGVQTKQTVRFFHAMGTVCSATAYGDRAEEAVMLFHLLFM